MSSQAPAESPQLLLVDDDDAFGQVLATALGRRGFRVQRADSLQAAQALLPTLQATHAVIDLRLGDGNGLDLVPQLLQRRPDMRIVVLSGYASIPTAIDAIKLGATYYLAKPIDAEVVVRAFEGSPAPAQPSPPPLQPPSVRRIEWEHIQRVLRDCQGNVSAAARALRMHRRTLQRKLSKRSGGL